MYLAGVMDASFRYFSFFKFWQLSLTSPIFIASTVYWKHRPQQLFDPNGRYSFPVLQIRFALAQQKSCKA